jgi:protein-arginine kinase activator protein McsA
MASPLDEKMSKMSNSYFCEYCDYNTSRKNNWERHLLSKKHQKKCHLSVTYVQKNEQKTSRTFSCETCGKNYKSRNGLWKHKKICVPVNMKVESQPAPIIQNITNNITNNNYLNVNLFLDKHCANAQTLKDFVDSITLSLKDLDYTTKNGYLEGMSSILTKQLEDLSPTDRPIHSTDEKRLKFMVKKEEGWVKDDGSQISKAVTNTKFKLVNTLTEWEKENPDYNNNPKKLDTWQKSLSAISPEPSIKEKCDKAIKKKLAKLASIKEAMNSIKE